MKKLMIAAAAAAMVGGVSAANCTPDPVVQGDCATVYQITLNVKTTKGVAQNGAKQAGSQCTPGGTGNCWVARVADTTKFVGYIYDCSCGCDVLGTGSVLLSDTKRKVDFDSPAFTTTFLHVMGAKQKDAEWAWTLASGNADYDGDGTRVQSYTLTGAGIGKYDTKNARYSSLSGNFAGTATASFDLKTNIAKNTCACDPSVVWDCNDLTADLPGEDTVAYGTWSVKYNASASKKYATKGTF